MQSSISLLYDLISYKLYITTSLGYPTGDRTRKANSLKLVRMHEVNLETLGNMVKRNSLSIPHFETLFLLSSRIKGPCRGLHFECG